MKTMLVAVLAVAGAGSAAVSGSVVESDQGALELARSAIAEMRQLRKADQGVCEADGEVLRYIGRTETDLLVCLERHPDASILRVTSSGGPVRRAIPAARELARREMSVEVLGFCGSSCGNYVLPAAREFVVLPYSAVMLHGAPKPDLGQDRERLVKAIKKSGFPPEKITEELIAEQLQGLSDERRMHVQFQQDFAVGQGWYELPFYYQAVERAEGEGAILFVSEDFAAQCLGKATEIAAFWEPGNETEEAAFRDLFNYRVWIVGRDVGAPADC